MAGEISSLQEVSTRGPGGPRGRRGVGLIVGTVVVGLLAAGVLLGDDDGTPAASERKEETTTTRSRTTSTRPRPTPTTTVAGPLFAGHVRPRVAAQRKSPGLDAGGHRIRSRAGVRPAVRRPLLDAGRCRWSGACSSGGEARFYDLRVSADVREPVSLGPANQILNTAEDGNKVWLVEAIATRFPASPGRASSTSPDESSAAPRSARAPPNLRGGRPSSRARRKACCSAGAGGSTSPTRPAWKPSPSEIWSEPSSPPFSSSPATRTAPRVASTSETPRDHRSVGLMSNNPRPPSV